MIEERFGEKWSTSIGMYIRSTSDILPKWKDIRSIADIPKLDEIIWRHKNGNIPRW